MDTTRLARLAGGGLHRSLADAIGNPDRVWCRQCGRSQSVDATRCLRSGWPKCCGYTMTIDAPEEPARAEETTT